MTKPIDLRELRDAMTRAFVAMKDARTPRAPAPATRTVHPLCNIDRGPTETEMRARAAELAATRKREAAERQAEKQARRNERDARARSGVVAKGSGIVTKAGGRDPSPQNGVTPDASPHTDARDTPLPV